MEIDLEENPGLGGPLMFPTSTSSVSEEHIFVSPSGRKES
jgi:hypothetical protein